MKKGIEIKRMMRWTRKPEVVALVAGSLVATWYLVNNLQDADPGLRAGIIGALDGERMGTLNSVQEAHTDKWEC